MFWIRLVEQVHGSAAANLPPDVELVRGDVRDPETVARVLPGCDGVFHLAAEVGVGQKTNQTVRYTAVNDLGTAVLLEQLSRRPLQRLVVAS